VTISTTEPQVLALLSKPEAVNVCLLRTLAIGYFLGGSLSTEPIPTHAEPMGRVEKQMEVDRMQTAMWWNPVGVANVGETVELQGEIHLPTTLNSSGHLLGYDLFVSVQIEICFIYLTGIMNHVVFRCPVPAHNPRLLVACEETAAGRPS
jgi:hypothetical protein